MKKILIIALIIGFACVGNALADESVYGDLTVQWMTINESTQVDGFEVIEPCTLRFHFITAWSDQEYWLTANALGTQLNLALWQAAVDGVTVKALLKYKIYPFKCDIMYVTYNAP